MYGSSVRPKIAGIESNANMMSTKPMATSAMASGVKKRLPSIFAVNLSLWYFDEIGMNFRSALMMPMSFGSCSGLSAASSHTVLMAVYSRKMANR